jgi:hypothetical protein
MKIIELPGPLVCGSCMMLMQSVDKEVTREMIDSASANFKCVNPKCHQSNINYSIRLTVHQK